MNPHPANPPAGDREGHRWTRPCSSQRARLRHRPAVTLRLGASAATGRDPDVPPDGNITNIETIAACGTEACRGGLERARGRTGGPGDRKRTEVAIQQRPRYTTGMARLTDSIRTAIKASEQTPYAIAKGAGVNRSQLSRLLSGESGLSVDTIERLADFLELRITIEPRTTTRKGR